MAGCNPDEFYCPFCGSHEFFQARHAGVNNRVAEFECRNCRRTWAEMRPLPKYSPQAAPPQPPPPHPQPVQPQAAVQPPVPPPPHGRPPG